VSKEFLSTFTKAGIEQVLDESGFAAWMKGREDGEKAYRTLLGQGKDDLVAGVLAGADIFGHMGISGVDQAASLPMLVLQDEVIDYLERMARGFEVSQETLAVEVIAETGPGGTFIASDHTVRHFRQELWFPRILDRQFYDHWEREGKKETAARAVAQLAHILRTHEPTPVEGALDREMGRIVDSARRALL